MTTTITCSRCKTDQKVSLPNISADSQCEKCDALFSQNGLFSYPAMVGNILTEGDLTWNSPFLPESFIKSSGLLREGMFKIGQGVLELGFKDRSNSYHTVDRLLLKVEKEVIMRKNGIPIWKQISRMLVRGFLTALFFCVLLYLYSRENFVFEHFLPVFAGILIFIPLLIFFSLGEGSISSVDNYKFSTTEGAVFEVSIKSSLSKGFTKVLTVYGIKIRESSYDEYHSFISKPRKPNLGDNTFKAIAAIGSEGAKICPRGHGELREWNGKFRCWTCGWPNN